MDFAEMPEQLLLRETVRGIASRFGEAYYGEKAVFPLTEPDAGSNTHNISTVAERAGDEYRLRGTKHYISGVDEAGAMVVVARTGTDERTGRGRLSLFVVPTDVPGLERQQIDVAIIAPEKQFTLFFDDVAVPAGGLLGGGGNGPPPPFPRVEPHRVTPAPLSP